MTLSRRKKLALHQGGSLIQTRWIYDEECTWGEYLDLDVTKNISGHLFDVIQLAADTTSRDIFCLVDWSPFLVELLKHHWIDEFLDEARSAIAGSIESGAESIDFLEIY